MNKKIRIWIGSIDKDGIPLSSHGRNRAITGLAYILSKLNGGCTQYEGKGYWVNSKNGSESIVVELVTVLESFTDKLDKSKMDYLRKLANDLKTELRQDSIAMEFNGRMVIV